MCRGCKRAARRSSSGHKRRQRAYYQRNKAAFRDRKLTATYGLSSAEYDALLASQDGRCACCRAVASDGKRPVVDHDHQTGAVRGIICHKCNRGIGLLGDSSNGVRNALRYLDKQDTAGMSAGLLF